MAEAIRDFTETPLITGEGTCSEGYTTLCTGYPDVDSLRHACIAVLGPQSSGKSTLLNDLFGTSFKMLDEDDGQQQIARGITARVIPCTESSPTILLLNCEGSDSRERHTSANQKLERRIGAFVSVTADVLIVNILQTDVDRVEGSCSNLLQSIFRVYFQLRNSQDGFYHRLKLFIAVRRCDGEGEDRMRMTLFYKVRKMYEESVPDEFREEFSNLINLGFWFIQDKFCEDANGSQYESDLYKKQIGEIRTQLSSLAAEAVQQPASSGRLPLTLAESLNTHKTIWGRICNNGNLDIPSMQEALSTEIAERCIEKFDAGLASLDFPIPATPQEILAAKLDPMRFVQSCADVASGAALSFDKQTEGYLDGPGAQQREALRRHIKSRLEDKAARVAKTIGDAAVGIMGSVSQNVQKLVAGWDGEAPLTGLDDAAVTLVAAVEELDTVYAVHRDSPLLWVQSLFHDPSFLPARFVEEIDIPQQPSGEGVYGSLSGLHASLLSWCIKLSAPLGVLCGVGETVAEARGALGSLLIGTRQAMRKAVEYVGLAYFRCAGERVHLALSDTSADPQRALAALYSDLLSESQTRVRHAAEALGWRGFPADGVLPRAREALLTLVQQELKLFIKNDAVGILARAMNAVFVYDGAELRSYESEGSAAARYSEARERLRAYMRSLGTVRLEGEEASVPGEQIDEVLQRADDEWGKMHSSVMERLRARQENQKLREMHEQASAELNRQREQIKAFEESARQQREEAERRQKELDEALKAANGEIASLRKELATNSARVDTLEQQLADTVKHLSRMNRLTPIKDPSWTDLMRAAANGNIEAVKKHLADKDKRSSDGDTALMIAARMEHEDIVELLDPTDEDGVTALMRAATRGDAEMVELLIPIQKEMKDKDGNTAFVHAIKNKHEGIATVLRKHEAPSWTPLMCAAFIGDVETARRHLSDKDKKNSDGETALILAARAGHEDIIELIAPTSRSGVTALMRAAGRGDVEAVKVLTPLQKGRKTDYLCSSKTALMRAATRGYEEVVKLLVEYEGGLKDEDGWTALMYAARFGHSKCVKFLLEKEAGIQKDSGLTALMYATYSNKLDCVKLLAEKEKDIKTTRAWSGFPPGTTALDIAKKMGRTEIISILSG